MQQLAVRRTGQRLPTATLRKMETAFGANFSDVRVFIGPEAASIGANAFAMGSDLYFAPGQYDPYSLYGQQLLGHELAHVLQQREGRVQASSDACGWAEVVFDKALEEEADHMGFAAAAGRVARRSTGLNIASGVRVIQCNFVNDVAGLGHLARVGTSNRVVALKYPGGTLNYPLPEYRIFLGNFIDKKTAIDAESKELAHIGSLMPSSNLVKGIRKEKVPKKAEYHHEGMPFSAEPPDKVWPFLLRVETNYGIDRPNPGQFRYLVGVNQRQVSIQFAHDKYGYLVKVVDSGVTYTMAEPHQAVTALSFSSLHDVRSDNSDLSLRGVVGAKPHDIDDQTKIIAEGARWKAVEEIRKMLPLRDRTRIFPMRNFVHDREWEPREMVPFVELAKLWISWNKFSQGWAIPNRQLALKISERSVMSGMDCYANLLSRAVTTGDNLIGAQNQVHDIEDLGRALSPSPGSDGPNRPTGLNGRRPTIKIGYE